MKYRELIAPGKSINLINNKNIYSLLIANDDITIIFDNKTIVLKKGFVTIGRCIRVFNHNDNYCEIRAIIYEFKDNALENPYILSKKNQKFKHHFEHIYEYLASNLLSIDKLSDEICEVIKKISVTDNELIEEDVDERLQIIYCILKNRYNEPLTLNYLAEQVFCNPVYLSNCYSKAFGISPMKHLQFIRMEEAKQLLLNISMTISEIKDEVGYISGSQFSTYFKKHTGKSPNEYRKEYLIRGEVVETV